MELMGSAAILVKAGPATAWEPREARPPGLGGAGQGLAVVVQVGTRAV